MGGEEEGGKESNDNDGMKNNDKESEISNSNHEGISKRIMKLKGRMTRKVRLLLLIATRLRLSTATTTAWRGTALRKVRLLVPTMTILRI